jgi:pyruvate formate lyase activating enzyme
VAVCPAGCHQLSKGRHSFDFSSCQQCGQCVTACPGGALTFIGRQASVKEVLAEALRDVPYYRSSGGGVTLSGGEAAAQPRFAIALLAALKEHGIHTCLESSGLGSTKDLRLLYSLADLVLLDFKHSDSMALKSWTGLAMAQFTKSLDLLQEMNRPVFLRCPLLEGVNATMSHIQAIAELALRYSSIQQIDLLPYHELGCDKATSLGLSQRQFTRPEQKTLKEFQQYLQEKIQKPVTL